MVTLPSKRSMTSPKLTMHLSDILLHFLFLSALIFSVRSETTNISFPHFSANDSTMRAFGDVKFNADNGSIIMNAKSAATRGSCAMLMYNGKTSEVHIQNSQEGTIASFSTSFTFKFTTPPEQKIWDVNSTNTTVSTSLSFVLTTSPLGFFDAMQVRTYLAQQPGACQSEILITFDYTREAGETNYFGIAFNSGNSFNKGEPSNNFIGIFDGLGDPLFFKAGYMHNLCGNQTHCSYFSNRESFTAWIDLTPERSLQVRLIDGSYPKVEKPLIPLLELLNYQPPTSVGDYVSLTFLASSAENHIQVHELLSWSFYNNGTTKMISWPKKKPWVGPVCGVSGTVATLVLLGYFSLWLQKHRHFVALSYSLGPRVFTYKELCIATKNFSEKEKLGSGGFGTVYKGSFKSSGTTTLVAVKRINYESKHAKTTFLAEISSLSQIRHGNIVQLQGWCHEKDRLLLVYTYMPNGSLNEWLHVSNNSSGIGSGSNGERRAPLPWKLRHRILQGVAAAVEYLHKDCPQCVLHRDIKSSNVMLDADFKAHLGDFGLARLMDHQRMEKTTMAAGTIGYMAPEMPYTGKATKESDVYSFGILVLEVVCGKRPLDLKSQEPEDMMLLHRVWRAHEVGAIFNVADQRLLQTCQPYRSKEACEGEPTMCEMHMQPCSSVPHMVNVDMSISEIYDIENVEVDKVQVEKSVVENLLRLGLLCCLPNPEARPSMEQVVRILQEIGDIDNVDYAITNISMPPVPDTKPLGLYHCMEFSQIADSV